MGQLISVININNINTIIFQVRLITEGTVQQCGTLELSRLPPANQDRQIQAKKLQKFHYIVCCVRFRIHHRTFLIMWNFAKWTRTVRIKKDAVCLYVCLSVICHLSVCQVRMKFGETEIKATAVDLTTGQVLLYFFPLRYHNILNTGQVLFMICFFCRQYHNIFTTGYFSTIFSQPDRLFYAFLLTISQCFAKISFSIPVF